AVYSARAYLVLVTELLACYLRWSSFLLFFFFFFFNDTATTEIYTLSLHDALPISCAGGIAGRKARGVRLEARRGDELRGDGDGEDRKSTRLNSSHDQISYAVFCLKKKKKKKEIKVSELE